MILSGNSLKYIFRDEQLLKQFLTLVTYCDLIVGSLINSQQKVDLLRHMKQFSNDGTFSMAVIS